MAIHLLFLPLALPLVASACVFFLRRSASRLRDAVVLIATAGNLLVSLAVFAHPLEYTHSWLGFGIDFSLRLYPLSAFILLGIAFFAAVIGFYSLSFMHGRKSSGLFFSCFLLSLGLANGAVMADNLLLLLFFWEGLLAVLYAMIRLGGEDASPTATKMVVIVGITDLCMMAGMAIAGALAGTLKISAISLPASGMGGLAFILLFIGAIAKAGAMPFHSWIPDAARESPLPFMAYMPAALEKLLGIYLLTRISLDMFRLSAHSWLSMLMMVVGAVTILLAVMMALIQKNYKKLLSYHAISQVGYMILGIGTCLPVGIIGGLFHMINHALYKSCLFLTAGSVERQVGTTNLRDLGGLGRFMPVTFGCFIITAASISGVPPFNGFFSKELIYDAALHRSVILYGVALLGSFLTAASFLKLGHAAFLGKSNPQHHAIKEAPAAMQFSMVVLALFCVGFGLFHAVPVHRLIMPAIGYGPGGHGGVALETNWSLVALTVLALLFAFVNHRYGVSRTHSALAAADHIHHAPILNDIYLRAERRGFDPYEMGLRGAQWLSQAGWVIDRKIDWLYEKFTVYITSEFSRMVSQLHNGSYTAYVAWSLVGLLFVLMYLVRYN